MGLVRNLANAGTFGLAGLALGGHKKKKDPLAPPQPSMITSAPMQRPTSMIGNTRGGY